MQQDNNQEASNWAFKQEDQDYLSNTPQPPGPLPEFEAISWTGSEFLDRHKNLAWYISLGIFISVVCAVIYLLSRDLISIIFIAITGVLFAIIASRKPKQVQYIIDNKGIKIGNRTYSFADFKSFSIQRDGMIGYVNLMPLKRLLPELSIYYAPNEEQKILNALSLHIPHDQVEESLVDKLFKNLHF